MEKRKRGRPPGARAEAKRLGLSHYVSDRPCKRGHTGLRRVRDWNCVECSRIHTRTYHRKHPEKIRELQRRSDRKQYEKHPHRAAYKCYKRLNPECIPPDWDEAMLEATRPFYEEARRLTRETGIRHEVDHIIPRREGGPHCAENLQVLTAEENQRKYHNSK